MRRALSHEALQVGGYHDGDGKAALAAIGDADSHSEVRLQGFMNSVPVPQILLWSDRLVRQSSRTLASGRAN